MSRRTFARIVLALLALAMVGGVEAISIAIGRWWLLPLLVIVPLGGAIILITLLDWAFDD